MVLFLIFVSTKRSVHLVEACVGPCQFCKAQLSVNIVERRSTKLLFCFIPIMVIVNRMAVCRSCGRSIRAAQYTMRESVQDKEQGAITSHVVEEKCWEDEEEHDDEERGGTTG